MTRPLAFLKQLEEVFSDEDTPGLIPVDKRIEKLREIGIAFQDRGNVARLYCDALSVYLERLEITPSKNPMVFHAALCVFINGQPWENRKPPDNLVTFSDNAVVHTANAKLHGCNVFRKLLDGKTELETLNPKQIYVNESGDEVLKVELEGKEYALKIEKMKDKLRVYKTFARRAIVDSLLSHMEHGVLKTRALGVQADFAASEYKIMTLAEWLPGGTLEESRERIKSDLDRMSFISSLLDIVGQMHYLGVIHCDLKPSNICLDNQSRPVLIDFGASLPGTHFQNKVNMCTLGYSAPEFLIGGQKFPWVTFKADLWSVGMIVFWLYTGLNIHPRIPTKESTDEKRSEGVADKKEKKKEPEEPFENRALGIYRHVIGDHLLLADYPLYTGEGDEKERLDLALALYSNFLSVYGEEAFHIMRSLVQVDPDQREKAATLSYQIRVLRERYIGKQLDSLGEEEERDEKQSQPVAVAKETQPPAKAMNKQNQGDGKQEALTRLENAKAKLVNSGLLPSASAGKQEAPTQLEDKKAKRTRACPPLRGRSRSPPRAGTRSRSRSRSRSRNQGYDSDSRWFRMNSPGGASPLRRPVKS